MNNPVTVQRLVQRRVRRRRMIRRVRRTLFVVGAVVLVGGAAFGVDRMVVALHRYYGSHSSTTSTVAPTASSNPTTTTAPGPPACASAALSAYVYDWQGTSSTMYETVTLTNISGSPCSLAGYPGLGVSAQNGTSLPAPTADVATLGGATGPTSVSPTFLTVAPGTRVWFELDYPDTCYDVLQPGATSTDVPNACYAGTTLQVTPPRTTSPLLVSEPLRFTYGTAGFDVGPFVAGTPPRSPPVSP